MKRFFNIAILAAGSLLAACGALFIPQDDTPQGEENVPAEPIGLTKADAGIRDASNRPDWTFSPGCTPCGAARMYPSPR